VLGVGRSCSPTRQLENGGVQDEIDGADVGDTSSLLFGEGGDFSMDRGMLEF
jgi:hypothetical protein